VGVTDGSAAADISSIGIDFASWTESAGLESTDAAIFWMDPDSGPSGSAVVAQLTVFAGTSATATMGLQGRPAGSTIDDDVDDWQQSLSFDISGSAVPLAPAPTPSFEWAQAFAGIDIATDPSVAVSSTHPAGRCCYRPAISSPVLQADAEHYIEFTLPAGLDGVMLGLARAGFDPTTPIEANGYVYGAYATGDGWMMEASSGNLYHDFINNPQAMNWVNKGRFEASGEVAMLLRNGQLLVFVGGRLLGVMLDGLVGEYVWAADLTNQESRTARIVASGGSGFEWPCCSTLCYPCGSGTACDFCDGSCNSAGASFCEGAHPDWDDNCDASC
jgi:hypothetical protein